MDFPDHDLGVSGIGDGVGRGRGDKVNDVIGGIGLFGHATARILMGGAVLGIFKRGWIGDGR